MRLCLLALVTLFALFTAPAHAQTGHPYINGLPWNAIPGQTYPITISGQGDALISTNSGRLSTDDPRCGPTSPSGETRCQLDGEPLEAEILIENTNGWIGVEIADQPSAWYDFPDPVKVFAPILTR